MKTTQPGISDVTRRFTTEHQLAIMIRPVCIVGMGYVGMACLAGLAGLGWTVHGYDAAPDLIERLRLGSAPYRDRELLDELRKHTASGALRLFSDLADAVADVEVAIVTVEAPITEAGTVDLRKLKSTLAELSLIPFATWPTVIIMSAVPPGTCQRLAPLVEPWGELIYAPEFLRESSAARDFREPRRIVIGASKPSLTIPFIRLFEELQTPLIFTSFASAELIRCASAAFLALKNAYANEIVCLCEALETDAEDVIRGMSYDDRIGADFFSSGSGFGRRCVDDDLRRMHRVAIQHETTHELVAATLRVSEMQPMHIVNIVQREIGKLDGATLAMWGLVTELTADDMRRSLALRTIEELCLRGAAVTVYDPKVAVAPLPSACRLVRSALEAAEEADALIVFTDDPEFAAIDPFVIAPLLRLGLVVDVCNVLDERIVTAAGLAYRGTHRGSRSHRLGSVLSRVSETEGVA